MSEYRHFDTKRPDGFYVTFERVITVDDDSSPSDFLFQDEDYRDADQARLDAFNDGDWYFIGIQARAHCWIILNGVGTSYTLTSPGLWGTESDSDEAYLDEVYQQEIATLKDDLAAMVAPQFIDA